MKLLFIIPQISTAGGVQKIVAQLSSYLQESGYQVTILNCLPFAGVSFYQIHDLVEISSLNMRAYPSKGLSKLHWYYQLIEPLNEFLANHHFNIVFAEGGYLSASLSLTRTKNTIKVGCEHVNHDAVNPIHGFLRRLLFKKLNALVVLTKADYLYYNNFLPRVYRIPNFIEKIPDQHTCDADRTIMAIGRLTYQKGFDTLINSFKLVNEMYPNWKLIIYGEGECRDELILQTKKAQLDQVVSLPGETSNVSEALKGAAIFVLSSRFEGFPLVLLEAMSQGICCVSFNISGVNELIIDNKNGSLVQAGNARQLAERILMLIESHELRSRLGLKGKETSYHYQLSQVGEEWKNLIKKLIQQP